MTTWKKCNGCGLVLTNDNDSEAHIKAMSRSWADSSARSISVAAFCRPASLVCAFRRGLLRWRGRGEMQSIARDELPHGGLTKLCTAIVPRRRPAMRKIIGRQGYCPSHDLLIRGCWFHFRNSFNSGRITNVAALRIYARFGSRCSHLIT
jgi:hypothetical protein